ncbi:MAG: SPOR domain-containing protein [Gemmatimonadaceae bacterium]
MPRRVRAGVLFCMLLAMGVLTRAAAAQGSPSGDSTVFARAQVLVSAGEGKAGRAVVDSLLATIPAASPRYAEGLFWRATLASNALDAERDYRRVAVEYTLSPRVPAALTRLAQLELARGDRAQARQHLERLLSEYPPRNERANAWYWLGRIAFESGDAGRGCTAIDSARVLVASDNIELTNQIAGDSRRCLSRADGSLAAGAPQTSQAPPAPAPPAPRAATTTNATPSATRSAAPSATPHAAAPAAKRGAASADKLTIQVGAYPTRAAAARIQKRLTAQGFDARVMPAGRYFRVRVGRFPNRSAAAAVATKLRARRYETMVVDAERPR